MKTLTQQFKEIVKDERIPLEKLLDHLLQAVKKRDAYLTEKPLSQVCSSKCVCDEWTIMVIRERQEKTL